MQRYFCGEKRALKGVEKCFLYSSWLDKFLRTHIKCCSPSLSIGKTKQVIKNFLFHSVLSIKCMVQPEGITEMCHRRRN